MTTVSFSPRATYEGPEGIMRLDGPPRPPPSPFMLEIERAERQEKAESVWEKEVERLASFLERIQGLGYGGDIPAVIPLEHIAAALELQSSAVFLLCESSGFTVSSGSRDVEFLPAITSTPCEGWPEADEFPLRLSTVNVQWLSKYLEPVMLSEMADSETPRPQLDAAGYIAPEDGDQRRTFGWYEPLTRFPMISPPHVEDELAVSKAPTLLEPDVIRWGSPFARASIIYSQMNHIQRLLDLYGAPPLGKSEILQRYASRRSGENLFRELVKQYEIVRREPDLQMAIYCGRAGERKWELALGQTEVTQATVGLRSDPRSWAHVEQWGRGGTEAGGRGHREDEGGPLNERGETAAVPWNMLVEAIISGTQRSSMQAKTQLDQEIAKIHERYSLMANRQMDMAEGLGGGRVPPLLAERMRRRMVERGI